MNTQSLTKNNALLKFLESLKTHYSGTSTSLQDDSLKQGDLSLNQHKQAIHQVQKTYSLERRCFF